MTNQEKIEHLLDMYDFDGISVALHALGRNNPPHFPHELRAKAYQLLTDLSEYVNSADPQGVSWIQGGGFRASRLIVDGEERFELAYILMSKWA
jgi:hypothetical protein